jgi:hypothetical protein
MKDYLHFTPLRVFKTAERLMRIYSEWRTGDIAWKMQVCVYLIHHDPPYTKFYSRHNCLLEPLSLAPFCPQTKPLSRP